MGAHLSVTATEANAPSFKMSSANAEIILLY